MRTGILVFVVFVAALALGALLWWRFKGNGRPAATPAAPVATRNHHSLPLFHYERAGAIPAQPVAAAAPPAPGSALASLLPEEDFRAQEAAELQAAETDVPRPVSSRHAAGAVASLLEVLDEASVAATEPTAAAAPASESNEEPAAPALFYNPITAPAPTANDQANRAAEIALRKQRRASMAADTAAQRTALSGLFPGATAKPAATKAS